MSPPAQQLATWPPANPWPGAVAIMLASMMVYLDTTVVNLSLPHMAGSLSAGINETTWSLTSYLAANAVVLPITGWLASLLGRKRLILYGVFGFIVASLLCGSAPNLPVLITFRVIQGLAGGLLQPLSQAVMLESFPYEERGKAMGFWSTGIVIAPVIGPLVGGYLTEHLSWRWVFFINVPFGLLGLFMVQRYIDDPPYLRRSAVRVDYAGLVLLALGIGALQVMLDQGQDEDWFESPAIVALAVLGAAGLVSFVVRSLTIREPVVDLSVFRHRSFAVGTLLSAVVSFVLFGSIVVLPLLLQTLLHYSPLQAGMVLMPRAFASMIGFPLVGLLADRVDPRGLFAAGAALGGITMFWLAGLNHNVGYFDLLWPQLLQGFALSLLFVPLSTISMAAVPLPAMGNASSVYNVVRNFGSSVGIAAIATYLYRTRTQHRALLAERVEPYSAAAAERVDALRAFLLARGADAQRAEELARAGLAGEVERQAAILSYLDAFRLFAVLFLVTVPCVLLLRRPPRRGPAMIAASD